jgi:hypothetical protein
MRTPRVGAARVRVSRVETAFDAMDVDLICGWYFQEQK